MKSINTKVLLIQFSALTLVLILSFHFTERIGLFIAFLTIVLLNTVHFFSQFDPIKDFFDPKEYKVDHLWKINEAILSLSIKNNIKIPIKTYITQYKISNCFVNINNKLETQLIFSEELLRRLNEVEILLLVRYLIHKTLILQNLKYSLYFKLYHFTLSVFHNFDVLFNSKLFTFIHDEFFKIIQRFFFKTNFQTEIDQNMQLADDEKYIWSKLLWKLSGWNQEIKKISLPNNQQIFFIYDPLSLNPKKNNLSPTIDFRIKSIIGYFPL